MWTLRHFQKFLLLQILDLFNKMCSVAIRVPASFVLFSSIDIFMVLKTSANIQSQRGLKGHYIKFGVY